MARPLRFIPPGSVVEITARTTGSRFLLRPDQTVNDLVLGCLGRAQALYKVKIFAVVVLSNHVHLDLGVDHAAQLADFMRHLLGNIALEVGRHHRWQGRFWGRRYRAIVIADEEAQVARLAYLLANGCKENLVDRAEAWPGVSSVAALTRGVPLRGTWFDRTAEHEARRRGEDPDPRDLATSYEVKLDQLPVWQHLPLEEYRREVLALVERVETDARALRKETGKSVLGVRRILEQDPHSCPRSTDKSPAPLVHAASQAVRRAFRAAYTAFVDAFRFAAACLRAGRPADFPEGSFPPPAPFLRPAPA